MNVLDPRSIVVISALLGVVILVILISLRRNVASKIQGIDEWIAAFVAVIVSVVLLILRERLHPFFGMVLANTLIISVALLFDRGLRRFHGEQVSARPLLLILVTLSASLVVVTFVSPNYPVRRILVLAALLYAFSTALWQLIRTSSGTFGARVTQIALAVPVAGVVLRLLTPTDVGQGSLLFRPSFEQSVYLGSLAAGILTAGVGFILMVNERTRAELQTLALSLERTAQELRQQNEIKSKFLAYAGHDIRQPLQAIHLLLASLMHSGLSARQQETAQTMESSVHALSELLDTLLDISKLDAGAIKPQRRAVDLDPILARLVQEFMPQAAARGLRLRLKLPATEVAVWTDDRLLSSVLRNLLGNAIKYTRHGGVLVAVRRAGQGLKVQVWDTGIGIAPEHADNIFEEYYQVDNPQRDRSRGLGLGLAIVSRISDLLELRIRCRSRPGKGTVMEITLPLAQQPPARAVTSQRAIDTLDLTGKRVVVVEDAQEVAHALALWLQAYGATVAHFTSADAALASPGIHTADLYLSDYRLPGQQSGIDFLNVIRSRAGDEVPAVLVTGDTSSQFIAMAASSGWPILFKPVHPRELAAILKLLLARADDPLLA